MPSSPTSEAIQHFCRAVLLRDGAALTDGQLLEHFLNRRDEGAFAALVRRHGPMVWGVCRRILRSHQDAEDAFQATFLVLVRRASSIVPREMVANWLYGVAYQTARKAGALAAKRKQRERQVVYMPESAEVETDLWPDLQPLLDQELSRLSDKYRAVIVLCDLEGKTRKEAARQLGVPEGTVAGRLARARKMLAKRLGRRGVALSGGLLATIVSRAASAGVPASVTSNTIHAAGQLMAGSATAASAITPQVGLLTEGVMKAMLVTKLKGMAVVAVMIGVVAVGITTAVFSPASVPVAAAANLRPAAASPADREPAKEKAQEPREQPREGPALLGTLQAVDAAKNSITVSTFSRYEGSATHTFSLAKDLKVLRDGKEAKLSDLKNDGRVRVTLAQDQKTVVSIHQTGAIIPANVKSVNVEKNTVTIAVFGRLGGQDKTYPIAKHAQVTLDEKAAKLADLKEGAAILLTVSLDDANTVIQIQSQPKRNRNKND